MDKRLSKEERYKEYKRFGYSFAIGMVILTLIGLWRHFPQPVIIITVFLVIYHLLMSIVWLPGVIPFFKLTAIIGLVIGTVLSWVIFGFIYYFAFTPIALVLRISGKDVIAEKSIKPAWEMVAEDQNNPKRIEKLY